MTIFYKRNDLDLVKSRLKRIFFFRVCGTGMGAAATLLKEAGYEVEGGDQDFYPPMSTYLEQLKIPLKKLEECNDDYLKSFDLIIVGNVVPKNSADAIRLETIGVPLTSFPQALGSLVLNEKKVIGISGTHGKTTTTFLGAQVFEALGEKPGYLIGGVLPNGPSAKLGTSKLFFIEADEYDSAYFEKTSKFLHYDVNYLILTSLEYDHADIFEKPEDILDSFEKLLSTSIDRKIVFSDDSMTQSLIKKFDIETTYGDRSGVGPNILKEGQGGTDFVLNNFEFSTNLRGHHNILNLSSVIKLAMNIGYSAPEINSAIKNLLLVKRRQELVGKISGAIVYDDFAHHPTAIEKTLNAMKKIHHDKKVIAIFEPASSTARSNLFQDKFPSSFKGSDVVLIIRPRRKTTVLCGDDLDIEKLKKDLVNIGKSVDIISDLESLVDVIRSLASPECIFVTLSNGKMLNLFNSDVIDDA